MMPTTEELAWSHLECDKDDLRGRGRSPEVVRTRELIGPVGAEPYGVGETISVSGIVP
jgi:hypothetical protein